jgi:hypothetical protein
VSHEGTAAVPPPKAGNAQSEPKPQLALFREYEPHPALDELRAINLDAMTPLQAFDALRRLRDAAQGD